MSAPDGLDTWASRRRAVGGLAREDLLPYTVSVVGGLGPLVAAMVVTRYLGGSVRAWVRPMTRWRVPVRYYVYALGLPPLLYGVIDILLALLGYDVELSLLAERAPAYLATLGFVAVLGGGSRSRAGEDSHCPAWSAGTHPWWRP